MGQWVYLNGEYLPQEAAKISVFDHGFLYGDGVFEGIRAYKGKVFKLNEHIQRLFNSAKAISLKIPLSQEKLKEKILEALRRNKLQDAYIRVVVSRGEGDLGLDPAKCPSPQLVIITDEISIYPEKLYEKGLEVVTSSIRRNNPSALDPRIKSLNYLNNILAKLEATSKGAPEAIMLNEDGYVAECTGDNLFIVEKGVLVTPPIWVGILKGITRDVVIELAKKEGIPVEEKVFTLFSVYTSDECFLTGTAAEVIPVTRVDGRVIGNGKVGPITRMLITKFRKLTEKEGVPIYPDN
ncbi:branched-chain amino acid aminotransferase [Candidatus Aerophobetes bacterium]|uniref:Branched-chain-amino-acid aminotransferase n=1 Tax=Aerophobetes bacterium TaxID=2030807 RepID=A0A662DIJ0_UNCAE|nr:MAG: branched-chain amino acid aminotransferase [Candidatus Aerophobetes bacterium]